VNHSKFAAYYETPTTNVLARSQRFLHRRVIKKRGCIPGLGVRVHEKCAILHRQRT